MNVSKVISSLYEKKLLNRSSSMGSYATVYPINKNYVIKVRNFRKAKHIRYINSDSNYSNSSYYIETEEDVWFYYAQEIVKNKLYNVSSIFPKITMLIGDPEEYVAKVEKLEHFTDDDENYLARFLLNNIISGEELPEEYYLSKDSTKYTWLNENLMDILYIKTMKHNYPDVDWDLHSKNFMRRSNGELVVTDPWF